MVVDIVTTDCNALVNNTNAFFFLFFFSKTLEWPWPLPHRDTKWGSDFYLIFRVGMSLLCCICIPCVHPSFMASDCLVLE
jgi:hypothetical protein